ncbi:MAG: 30S ribosome-binding factor RbfA [Planctomycetota bacterium]|jgi:ribosome-binding factor A
MTNPRTIAKLQARILERAAHCVEFEIADPRLGMVTLTRCELSADLGHAKLLYTVMGGGVEKRQTQRVLEDAAGFVQRQVGRVLQTRRIPRIHWQLDESIEYADEMDRKIRDALNRDREVRGERGPGPHGVVDEEEQLVEQEYEDFLEEQDEGRA